LRFFDATVVSRTIGIDRALVALAAVAATAIGIQ